jgi:hypothetical protein
MTITPSPSSSDAINDSIIEKIKLVIEGENAAVWAFGYLLSFIPEKNKQFARSTFDLHRNQRDLFRLKLRNLGITPPRPKENYDLPFEVTDIVKAYELASYIENRLIGIYIQLFSIEYPQNRKNILQFSFAGALRMLEFKDSPRALPGSIT